MSHRLTDSSTMPWWASILLLAGLGFALLPSGGPKWAEAAGEESHSETEAERDDRPTTFGEARGRARLLHETLRGSLQVMHRDYFDDESPLAIPSSSLEDVFAELARSYHVDLKWLTVETDVLNVDHKPEGEFEQQAVKALAAGKNEFEATDKNTFRYAGAVRLGSQCLKCHVKTRTSTETRTAGLVITMPLKTMSVSNRNEAPTLQEE